MRAARGKCYSGLRAGYGATEEAEVIVLYRRSFVVPPPAAGGGFRVGLSRSRRRPDAAGGPSSLLPSFRAYLPRSRNYYLAPPQQPPPFLSAELYRLPGSAV